QIQLLTVGRLTTTQGGTATAPIIINRNAFGGQIMLTGENLPSGVTASFDPAATSGTSSTMSLAIGPTASSGDYRIRVKGSATGIADATADVDLTIISATVSITL